MAEQNPSGSFADQEIGFDEMEQVFATPKAEDAPPPPPDLNTIKIDGEKVPEQYRGKSAAELIALTEGLQSALKISEQSRLQNGNNAAPVTTTPTSNAPVYNRDAIKQMVEDGDTVGAMENMLAYANAVVQQQLDARLAPLSTAAGAGVEYQAKQQYKEEFDLFGDQINQLARQAGSANMSAPGAWDQLISFVRGQPQNFDKLVAHRTNASRIAAAQSDLPPNLNDGSRRSAPNTRSAGKPTKQELASDPVVQDILRATGMSIDEYYHYM